MNLQIHTGRKMVSIVEVIATNPIQIPPPDCGYKFYERATHMIGDKLA